MKNVNCERRDRVMQEREDCDKGKGRRKRTEEYQERRKERKEDKLMEKRKEGN